MFFLFQEPFSCSILVFRGSKKPNMIQCHAPSLEKLRKLSFEAINPIQNMVPPKEFREGCLETFESLYLV